MRDRSPTRSRYGAGPLHLLALIASFGLAGYAALKLIADRPVTVIAWFVGAAVLHDLILLPLYVLADRGVRRTSQRTRLDPPAGWINYIRFPAAISGMLLLIFFPSIARLSGTYTAITGLSAEPYLAHWLAVTGALFLVSAIVYAVRLRRSN